MSKNREIYFEEGFFGKVPRFTFFKPEITYRPIVEDFICICENLKKIVQIFPSLEQFFMQKYHNKNDKCSHILFKVYQI